MFARLVDWLFGPRCRYCRQRIDAHYANVHEYVDHAEIHRDAA